MHSKLINTLATSIAAATLLALGGCASDTPKRLGSAAVSPLNDLNVVRADIPDILEEAQKAPYQMPKEPSCTALALEIRKLDEVLGADLDAPPTDKRPSLIDRASGLANDQAVSALQRTAQDLVPFRGWVRKLTGAERYSKRVAASIAAGSVRRGFLKGVASAQSCLWRTTADEAPNVESVEKANEAGTAVPVKG